VDAFVLVLLLVALTSYYCEPEHQTDNDQTMEGGLDAALMVRGTHQNR
jgi:hypothetical protein